jgi:hypothetical protein
MVSPSHHLCHQYSKDWVVWVEHRYPSCLQLVWVTSVLFLSQFQNLGSGLDIGRSGTPMRDSRTEIDTERLTKELAEHREAEKRILGLLESQSCDESQLVRLLIQLSGSFLFYETHSPHLSPFFLEKSWCLHTCFCPPGQMICTPQY